MIAISIVIPSLGQTDFLFPLLSSLATQRFDRPFEVILCTTGVGPDLNLPHLGLGRTVRVCNSPIPGISQARNVGIAAAVGQLVLFLDEDCILNRDHYLQTIYDFHLQNPICGGGGAYLTLDDESNFASAFYNYMCNSWLESHVDDHGRAQVLLGGCCFYPREKIADLRFPEHKPRAGEEIDFNQNFIAQGNCLQFKKEWSVCHHPNYNWEDVLRRAWKHGSELQTSTALPPQHRLTRFLRSSRHQPNDFIKFLPLTLVYSLWGRTAFASKWLRK